MLHGESELRLITHVAGIAALTACIVLCTLLPFLPGRYDPLAPPLSLLSQLFGIVGLLLVPVGVIWIVGERLRRTATTRYVFGVLALIATSIVGAILAFAASLESLTLGLSAIVLWCYLCSRLFPRLKSLRSTTSATRRSIATPWYLLIVPTAVALTQLALARPVSEFTRNRAIRNSAVLIADIEQYRARNGRYPGSLIAVNKDYQPSIIGIKEYLYEPSGDAYNLLFEQSSFHLGVREFVMYNPRDQHAMTSHAMDRLQLTPEQLQLDQTRGHNALHETPLPHWKYFWFD